MSGYTASLVVARWRYAWRRWLLVVVALASAVSLLVIAKAAGTVTEDAALRRGISDLPTSDRILTVATFRGPGEELPPDLDARARGGLARLGSTDPVAFLMFRELADAADGTFQLAAAEDLDRWVELLDGRMPERCEPTRCEVVQLAERRPVGPIDPALGVVVVGTVARREPMLLAGMFEPRPETSILLADGVGDLGQLEALELFGRSFGWTSEVDLPSLRAVGVDQWTASAVAIANDVITSPWDLRLTAPDEAINEEVARARRSAGRFRILGGTMAILLLGVAAVGGAAMRRDHESFRGALRRRGMSTRRLGLATGVEVGGVVGVATVVGLIIGGTCGAVLAWQAGLSPSKNARSAILGALPSVAALAASAAALCIVLLLRQVDPRRPGGGWRIVEVWLVAVTFFGALLISQGDFGRADASGNASVLPILPIVVLAGTGLLAARLWPIIVQLMFRVVPQRRIGARIGVASVQGRPLRPAITAAAVAAALGAVVFAVSYRQTLARGAADQAADVVPLDARLTTGPTLERPLDVLTPELVEAIDGEVSSVLRAAASLRVTASRGEVVQMIGVDPAALPNLRRWDAIVGVASGEVLAEAIDVPSLPPVPVLPPGRVLTIDATGPAIQVGVTAHVRSSDGRTRAVILRVEPEGGRDAAVGSQSLVGDLPDLGDGPLELVSLVASEPIDAASMRQHNLGEGRSDRSTGSGSIVFGALDVDGRQIDRPWVSFSGMQASPDETQATLNYVMAAFRYLVPSQPESPGMTSAAPIPLAVDASTAASAGGLGGEVTLILNAVPVHGRVASVLPQFPTVTGRFAVLDRAALERIVDITSPGAGQPGEMWISLASDEVRLDDANFRRLTVVHRGALEDRLRTDPVSRSATDLLSTAAAVMFLLALIVTVLLVIAERHDDAAALQAWEAQGVTPAELRRSLTWRAFAVVAPALPIGLIGGWSLAHLTAVLIPVTASAGIPRPPLVAGTGVWWAMLLVCSALVVTLLIARLVALRSMREPLPPRLSRSAG